METAELVRLRRAEMRWNAAQKAWDVFAPVEAFKNKGSSFFGKKPFHARLPDLAGLYPIIDAYLNRHRKVLLKGSVDPGTFFVRLVTSTQESATFKVALFYLVWRRIIIRYGIYNPYTRRGAIVGLKPHGPHAVRDILATHILKMTGSYELASFAIQNTPQVIAKHYGRFLPVDKTALAADILNDVWRKNAKRGKRKGRPKPPLSVNAVGRPKWRQRQKDMPPY